MQDFLQISINFNKDQLKTRKKIKQMSLDLQKKKKKMSRGINSLTTISFFARSLYQCVNQQATQYYM